MSGDVDLFATFGAAEAEPEPEGDDAKIQEKHVRFYEVDGYTEGAAIVTMLSVCCDCRHRYELHQAGKALIPCYAELGDGTRCGCRCFKPPEDSPHQIDRQLSPENAGL